MAFINGFSKTARDIFDRFKFNDQIEKLDNSNRLFAVIKAMAAIDLHPDRVDILSPRWSGAYMPQLDHQNLTAALHALQGVEVITTDATKRTENGLIYADFFDFT